MKRQFVLGMISGAALTAITAIAVTARSETTASLDPVKLSPQLYAVLFENERVRVLEYRLEPGGKEQMHSHPAGVVYSFGAGKLITTLQDGSSKEIEGRAGEVHWRDPITHTVENTGTTELHALAIEMKKTCN